MDDDTLQRARRGDSVALEIVLREVAPRLLGVARRLTPHNAEAEELVEEALYRGGMNIAKLRDRSALGAWFRQILIAAWHDRLRRRERRRSSPLDDVPEPAAPVGDDPIELSVASETRERLGRAVAALPPIQRAVVALHYGEGLGVGEIASAMSSTPDRVKANLWHARKRLRGLLGETADDGGGA